MKLLEPNIFWQKLDKNHQDFERLKRAQKECLTFVEFWKTKRNEQFPSRSLGAYQIQFFIFQTSLVTKLETFMGQIFRF